MSALILNQHEIEELLPMDACMDVVADALRALAKGQAKNPLRTGMPLPGDGILGLMPGSMESPASLGLKVVAVFPSNHGTKYDSHQGLVVLFDPTNGAPRAILDAATITKIRTGAASGVATRLLANEDAGDVAIIGSGVQATSHLAAMAVARSLRRVRVWSPNEERCAAFARRESERYGIDVEVSGSAQAAVEGADLVCTTTASSDPVVRGEWLSPGTHINAAGSSVKTARELDTDAVAMSRLFIDRRESAVNEAGDYLIPLAEGAITEDHIIGEIGDLLLGRGEGRRSDDEITLFKSLGLAVEDLSTASYLVDRARELGRGTEVEIGGIKEGFNGADHPH